MYDIDVMTLGLGCVGMGQPEELDPDEEGKQGFVVLRFCEVTICASLGSVAPMIMVIQVQLADGVQTITCEVHCLW